MKHVGAAAGREPWIAASGRSYIVCGCGLLPADALAHGFGRLYNLPVPFWLYAWGAGAALLVSFLLIGYFATARVAPTGARSRDLRDAAWVRQLHRAIPALRGLAVFLLALCIATALLGTRDSMRNFSMTFFWVTFVLGATYLTALLGNFYEALNPWRTLADAVERWRPGTMRGRVRYPERLGDWPALALYLGFIGYELYNNGLPSSLGTMLLAYTVVNLAGAWLVGTAAWFTHCELFSVFLRLVALMAPLDYRRSRLPGERSTLRWRAPLSGIIEERPQSLGTVVFALAMLATTAFDGLRATQWWVGLFWKDPTGIVTALAGSKPILVYPQLLPWYIRWEIFWLVAAPFLYFGLYIAFVAMARVAARGRSVRELALDFGYTLLPIALVYHVTHYWTLGLTQGLKIVSLFSDPFGKGWNLLGTAQLLRRPILPSMDLVWHSQVALILLGHIISVYAAHRVALRVFPSRGAAVASQVPQLALMVLFTVAGLWILAQPLTAEVMR